jgi:hypothetical protein
MKIFITSFEFDGVEYTGPNIFAENHKTAEVIAEYQGLQLDGELQEIHSEELYGFLKEFNEKRVLH